MFVMPYQVSSTSYRVFIVLDEVSLGRMRAHDPGELALDGLGEGFKDLRCEAIEFSSETDEDMKTLVAMATKPGVRLGEIRDWLNRGFQESPDDHDGPPMSIKDTWKETTQ